MTSFVQHTVDALSLGSLYMLVALGIALIFGIMRLINLAHGEIIAIGAYAALAVDEQPRAFLVVVPIVTAIGVALAMDRLAFRPVRDATPATLLVTSFTLSFIAQNALTAAYTSTTRSLELPTLFVESFKIGGVVLAKLNVIVVVTAALLVVALTVFLRRTSVGIEMRAASEDFLMARLLGVRANVVIAAAFALSGLLAGVVALIYVAQTGTVTPRLGLNLALVGFVATVIGGMGSILAASLGGFALGVATVAFQAGLPLELRPYRDAFVFGLVIAVLLLRPDGLFIRSAATQRM